MSITPWYPLRFDPIFKTALWGGRRLGPLLGRELPASEAYGEAWLISDQGDTRSVVRAGPLTGQTLRDLLLRDPIGLLGRPAERFPLLLKFIDACQDLSVQVHPHDRHTHLLTPGEGGKTEAWVILQAEPGSRIYAGLKPGVGPEQLRAALAAGTVADCLHSFTVRPQEAVFLPAGTVHAIGAGILLFEIQQTSNVTFRLFDWNRLDAKGKPRQLHVAEALDCIDFSAGPCEPIRGSGREARERLVTCGYFTLNRIKACVPFEVGAVGACRILVGLEGRAQVEHQLQSYSLEPGEVLLLPAALGPCWCRPEKEILLLECGLPD